jgi:hypothetical protein
MFTNRLLHTTWVLALTASFGMAAPLEVLDENIDEHRISELMEKYSVDRQFPIILSEKEPAKQLALATEEFLLVAKAVSKLSRVTYHMGNVAGTGKIKVGGVWLSPPGNAAKNAAREKRAASNVENARKLELLTEMQGTLLRLARASLDKMDPALRRKSSEMLEAVQLKAAASFGP